MRTIRSYMRDGIGIVVYGSVWLMIWLMMWGMKILLLPIIIPAVVISGWLEERTVMELLYDMWFAIRVDPLMALFGLHAPVSRR